MQPRVEASRGHEKRWFILEAKNAKKGVLELGEYHARLVTEEHPAASKFRRHYVFLYSDATQEGFYVLGEKTL